MCGLGSVDVMSAIALAITPSPNHPDTRIRHARREPRERR